MDLPTVDRAASAASRRSSPRTLPTLAGHRALRLFCTPGLSDRRAPDHDVLAERARFHLRDAVRRRVETRSGPVETYVLEPSASAGSTSASVLLVHGWTSEASFMGAFADFFRRRGWRAVLLDMPAHGTSPGRYASLIDCAKAVSDVAEAHGPIDFAIGHSVGGLAALLVAAGRPPMPRAIDFRAIVAVATPDRFTEVTRRFGEASDLGARAQRDFERRLERLAKRPIGEFTGSRLLREADRPALLIHARDDAEVPFADAEQIVAAAPNAELQPVDGLGHRAILYAPHVVKAAHAFLARHL